MRLRHLTLHQFRSHAHTELDASPNVNLLVGPNGAGKTNVLEALGYLGLGKSFLGTPDATVLQRGADHFSVEGRFAGDERSDVRIRLAVVPGQEKRAFVNGSPLDTLASLVGRIPCVILSPDDIQLTAGGPAERRRLLDTTLSQAYPAYLDDSLRYRRALKQKNALLQHARRGRGAPEGSLDAWDEELSVLGARVVQRRRTFLDGLAERMGEAHSMLGEPGSPPTLRYQPSIGEASDSDEDATRAALRRTRRRSLDLGRTLVGPHLDEVLFQLDGFDLRPFASQGQHRTFALIVRIAQALFFCSRFDEPPILLLDDVFGPLDPERTNVVLSLLVSGTLGQSFITAARTEPFEGIVPFESSDHSAFHVERGTVTPLSSLSPPLAPS